MELLILYAFLTISLSFLCSILEAVLLSINQTFLKIKINEGKSFAIKLQKLKEKIDEPLIVILTLNTISHTVGAILVGVQAKIAYSGLDDDRAFSIAGITINEDLLVGIVSTIMTILILLVSEIIPKTLGAQYWRQLSKFTSVFLSSILPVFKYSGVLWILKFFTRLIAKSKKTSNLTIEDFSAMADIAEKEGVIEEMDSDFIKNIVKLKNVKVRDIMTPFSVMKIADENISIHEFYNKNTKLAFSRIPIYSKSIDKIKGYVLKDTILEKIIQEKGNLKLSQIKRPIIITYNESKIPNLFSKLLKEKEHISLVVDEYGSIRGLVTLEDVIETMLGLEIVDETDTVEDLQLLAKNRSKGLYKN